MFGGILGTFFYTKALGYVGYIDLSVVVLLQKLQPFFAISLACLLLKERLTARFVSLALVAVAGGYLITFPGLVPNLSGDTSHLTAALLAVGAAFAWGSSTVFGRSALLGRNFFLITALRLAVTAVIAGVIAVTIGQHTAVRALGVSQIQSLLLIVVSTGSVALCIYYYGLKRVPASRATLYELVWPLSAIVLEWVIRGTMLTPTQLLGAALLLGAIVLLPRSQTEDISKAAEAVGK